MGKSGGFMEFRRREPGYRPKTERVRDFKAVERLPADAEIRDQSARCMECGTPFCHALGCPLKNVIPEINELVYEGRWREALELLLSTNNFPEFTGRVCPALCEASCVLGINDEPTTIRQVELAVIEKGFAEAYIRPQPPAVRFDRKVAVIGSGPAGLAVADCLNKAGYPVTVFDGDKKPGGILRYGIPDFKLEKWVVDRRIQLMKDEGVVFEMEASIGDDISAHYLLTRFAAICLAGGAREPRDLKIPGRDLKGIHFALEYLIQQNWKLAGETVDPAVEINAAGGKVAVIGGGDTGSDCIGTAWRQGAAHVTQFEILPQPPAGRAVHNPWPQWPNILRESSSHKEGGDRRWSVRTTAFLGDGSRVRKLRCIEVEWTPAADKKPPALKDKPGTEFEIEADLVLLAMGFIGPKKSKLSDDLKLHRDEKGNVTVDSRCMSNVPGVFAAGDVSRGASLVVRAIADGRKAAAGIMDYLSTRRAPAGKT
ncbi:MAG: glutamate synthase subunit beta [Lentisphaerae bacterium]|nr:glutamate synthase subunit beta [Lentisphaerota bacterium]